MFASHLQGLFFFFKKFISQYEICSISKCLLLGAYGYINHNLFRTDTEERMAVGLVSGRDSKERIWGIERLWDPCRCCPSQASDIPRTASEDVTCREGCTHH